MARENKLKGMKRVVTEESSVAAMENYISQSIEVQGISFDYSSLTGLEESDIKSLKNCEQALLFEGKKLGTVALEIGKNLIKAREIFIKSHADSFVSWYEALGLSKDQVTVFTSRYKLSVEYPEQKEKILSLSDRVIRETINKKNPENIMERVLSGELKTALDIKKERENNSIMIEKFPDTEEIEEAEIVGKINLGKFIIGKQSIISSLDEAFKRIKSGANTSENMEKLLKVKEILDSIE